MHLVKCRTFLGCLSLNSGVWLLAVLGAMLSGAGATGSWLEVTWLNYHPIPLVDEIALFVQATIFTVLGVLSVYGFISAATRSRDNMLIYSKMLILYLALTLLSFGLTLYSTFRSADPATIARCIDGSLDDKVIQFCETGWSIVKGLPIALFAVTLLVQSYAYILAINQAIKLDVDSAPRFSRSFAIGFPIVLGSEKPEPNQYRGRRYNRERTPSFQGSETNV